MEKLTNALQLGATMYIPATHDQLWEVTQGIKYPELKSVVVCLEDSVHDNDYDQALKNLKTLLNKIESDPFKLSKTALFIRPRNVASANRIANWGMDHCFNGFIIPKFTLENMLLWSDSIKNQKNVMLTLESGEYFDMSYVSELKQALLKDFRKDILCLRIGGNDLLSSLNLRRPKDCTIYDTPIGALIPQLIGQFVPFGFQLSSPVFEHYSDENMLKRELALDKVNGLLTKTAIHPNQLKIIHESYRVSSVDYYEAQMIVDANAKSVFKSNGSMLEPATHRNWAKEILLRAKIYGVVENHIQLLDHPAKQAV